MAALAWYGERPAAEVRTALAAAGLEPLPADRRSWQGVAQACIVACPPANEEALHASFAELPPLQELSFRLPAGRLLIWDPCGACAATVPTDIGMTGVARPTGPPSASDPWQLNDYALARWVHITAFLVGFEHDRLATCCTTVISAAQLLEQLAAALPESPARQLLRDQVAAQKAPDAAPRL